MSVEVTPRSPIFLEQDPWNASYINVPISEDARQEMQKDERFKTFLTKVFPSSHSLYSDSGGKIKEVFLQYNRHGISEKISDNLLLDIYKQFLSKLDANVKVTVLVYTQNDKLLIEEAFAEFKDSKKIEIIITNKEIDIWTRDSAIPSKNPGNGKAQEFLVFERIDAEVAKNYDEKNSNIADIRHRTKEDREAFGLIPNSRVLDLTKNICLDGGDIICTPSVLFVGEKSVNKTINLIKSNYSASPGFKEFIYEYYKKLTGVDLANLGAEIDVVLKALVPHFIANIFNKKVIVVGLDNPHTNKKENQPVFHIDMFISAAKDKSGKSIILLGNPETAMDIFENLPRKEQKKNQYLELIIDRRENKNEMSGNNNFNSIADYLKKEGFSVMYVPYLYGSKEESLPYVSYTNNIIEDYMDKDGKHIKRIFLPQYNIEPLDKETRRIYENLGYEVVPIDCSDVAAAEGALRCITQVIKEKE